MKKLLPYIIALLFSPLAVAAGYWYASAVALHMAVDFGWLLSAAFSGVALSVYIGMILWAYERGTE